MRNKRYFTADEIKELLEVTDEFLERLEAEDIIRAEASTGPQKCYLPEEADKIRFAHILIYDMGVNIEGVEVAVRLREVMDSMRLQMDRILDCVMRDIREKFLKDH